MNKIEKSTALYRSPFCLGYWRDAAAELKDTRMLVFAALIIALRVAMKMIYIPLGPNLKISAAFLANALGAMVYGPVVGALGAIISDVLGVMLSGDTYFVPFVLTEIAGTLVFALFLYRARVTPTRVILSRFCICLFVNILLQTPIMMLYFEVMMGGKTYVLTIPGILKNLFMFPIESVVLTLFLSVMQPITYRMKLTYNSERSLRFKKSQIATLAALFIFGCGCVVGYLGYYYENTSLTVGYTTQERVEKNQTMDAIIEENLGRADEGTVSIIGSAYRPFLGSETTYNVAYYAVDPDTDTDMQTLWSLKKTPASQEAALTLLGDAQIVLDDKTGQVLQYSYTPAT